MSIMVFKYIFHSHKIMIEEIYNKYSFSLIALLILHAVAQNVMLASSNRNTTITFPPERKVIKENNHTTAQKNFLGNDAHWIWVNGTDASNYGFLAIFQALFYADCPDQDSEVKITGYDIFTAYLNGIHVGAGENYRFLYFFKAKLICGLNNLTIIVMNKDQSASGSLIFSLTQDRTSCYLCKENPSGIYDRNTCKCECSAYMSNFPAQKEWIGYPFCGIRCLKKYVKQCDSAIQFWNESICNCECKKRWCPKNQFQSIGTCQCFICTKKCQSSQKLYLQSCRCIPVFAPAPTEAQIYPLTPYVQLSF